MVNPFEDPISESPPSTSKVVTGVFGEATTEAKESVLREVSDLAKAAHELDKQVTQAKKSRSVMWLKKLEAFAKRIASALVEFIKKAIELAVFKLVLELCAMIMNSIMTALTSRGNQRMEITTPGVHLTQPGSQPTQQRGTGNPFDGPFGSNSAVTNW